MIKFFRKIRQRLLTENKFSKYLLYAIGEIILVVLGILIALQINNWKTYQNERQVEYSYLKSLKEELALNKEISQAQIVFCNFQRENALTALNVISQNYNDNNTISILVAIEHIGFQNSANFHENVWQELGSTGNLRLIQNNVLKTDFSNLIREMKILKEFEQEWNSYNYGVRRLVGSVVSPNLRFLVRSGLSPLAYSGHVDKPSDSESEAIIKKLKGIEQLDSYLVDIVGTRNTNIALANGILEKIEEVNVLIDKELIKSENYK